MRFSDLKKKLLLLVGVIAAFALLGLMMLPSINEKMGLDADSCFASTSEYSYYGPGSAYEHCEDAFQGCVANCSAKYRSSDPVAYCAPYYEAFYGTRYYYLYLECIRAKSRERDNEYKKCWDWCKYDKENCVRMMQKGGH